MANSTEFNMNICYSGNERVFPLIFLSALSIVEHTASPIKIYLLTMDLSDRDPQFTPIPKERVELLRRAVQAKNERNEVELLDAREAYFTRLLNGKNERNHYTPYAMGRLLLSDFELPERILYLDSDVMCCSDLSQIFEIDVENYEYAAALDVMGKFWIHRRYCNSGVMYMNLERMKKTCLLERCCQYVRTHKLAFPDQTALNRLAGSKLILPPKFNEQRGVKEDTVLKHFCRGIKWLPFFHVYNIKQSDVKKVRNKLKIHIFDRVYDTYKGYVREGNLPVLGVE